MGNRAKYLTCAMVECLTEGYDDAVWDKLLNGTLKSWKLNDERLYRYIW